MTPTDQNKGEKRRFRFRLRSLLVVMALVSVLLAMLAGPVAEQRRQQYLLDQARERGAKILEYGFIFRDQSPVLFVLSRFDRSYHSFGLYELDLSGTKFTDDDLSLVAELKHVRVLNLAGTQVSDDGLQNLKTMPYLEILDLRDTHVTDEGIAHLARVESLASLGVTNTEVTYDALEKLDASLPHAHFCEERAIEELRAAGVSVWPPLARRIKLNDPTRFPRYSRGGEEATMVNVVSNTSLSDAQVKQIGRLRSLRSINLHDNVVLGPEGLAPLGHLPELAEFGADFVHLTDADLEVLSQHTQLESLSIQVCDGMTEDGLEHLRSLSKLKSLHIVNCPGVSEEAMIRLLDELPNVKKKPRFR